MKNILVGIDDCETTSIASPIMQRTLELADAFSSQVWLLHVVPETDRYTPFNIDSSILRREVADELSSEHDYLQRLAGCLRERGVDARSHLVQGATIRTILEEAERLDIDLIILGCHRHQLGLGVLTDFAAQGMLSKCPRPILFIPLTE